MAASSGHPFPCDSSGAGPALGWGLYLAFVCALAATDRGEGPFDEVVDFLSPRRTHSLYDAEWGLKKAARRMMLFAKLGASNKVEVLSVEFGKSF